MRQITRQSIESLFAGENFSLDNTRVDENTLYLHGSPIIQIREDGVWIQTAGWDTTTTKERLNGLPKVRVYHKKGQLHLNDNPWDGNWTKVDTDLL